MTSAESFGCCVCREISLCDKKSSDERSSEEAGKGTNPSILISSSPSKKKKSQLSLFCLNDGYFQVTRPILPCKTNIFFPSQTPLPNSNPPASSRYSRKLTHPTHSDYNPLKWVISSHRVFSISTNSHSRNLDRCRIKSGNRCYLRDCSFPRTSRLQGIYPLL